MVYTLFEDVISTKATQNLSYGPMDAKNDKTHLGTLQTLLLYLQ
jgi:hypothetical protein